MFVLFAIQSVPWLLGALAYGDLANIGTPHVGWLWLGAAWVLLASPPAHIALQCVCTRVLLRDLRPGRYSRYSSLAARLWFVDRLAEVTRFNRLGGTPWADRYARLVGADVGEGARLATVPPAGSLLHIGAGATVESNVDLRGLVDRWPGARRRRDPDRRPGPDRLTRPSESRGGHRGWRRDRDGHRRVG